MADLTGTVLGKYKIVERRGRGGMATVYKAHHPRLDRDVAIKVLHSHLAETKDFLGRFEREARAVAALRHPHIAQAFDFDVEGDIYYLVMEYIDGPSLEDRLHALARQGMRMPLPEAVGILHQVADALDYAHQQGMLHRDLKPSNVLLDRKGQAYLVDFGIARMLSGTQYTSTGELLGTPAYMSPEQGQGLTMTGATDIYSLGVMFYEMVTGQVPFDADTPFAVIHKHVYDPLPAPRTLVPDLPVALENVIVKALAKDPAKRYQSAREMAAAAEQALVGWKASAAQPAHPILSSQTDAFATAKVDLPEIEKIAPLPEKPAPVAVRPASVVQPPPVVPAKPVVQPSAAVPAPKRRKKGLPFVMAVIVVLALAAILGFALRRSIFQLFTRVPAAEGLCMTIDDCIAREVNNRNAGRMEAGINAIDRAFSMIPPGPQPTYAFLWCDRGDGLRALGRRDEALANFHACFDWTQNDTDLEPVRIRADQAIRELSR